MNYNQTLEYIHSLERFGIKPGLERITELCSKCGNPQNNLKFIHIAGTNGKGSTSSICASVLTGHGLKTGLFTSPYVTDFRERIQIDGKMIEPEELSYITGYLKDICEKDGITATEFEFITAVALVYFSRQKCDCVVLEVGLGGRFDATNVIPAPEAAVITSLSLDHMSVLGDTIDKIAFEKCGIIKPGCRVISYPLQTPGAMKVIGDKCAETGCELIIPDAEKAEICDMSLEGTRVRYKEYEYTLRLPGIHMVYNSITAIEAVKAAFPEIPAGEICEGISETVMAARTEIICRNPLVILDGGHNRDCAKALRKFMDSFVKDRNITVISSLMADKEYDAYIAEILPKADRFIAVKANVPRALDDGELYEAALKYCNNCSHISDPAQAVKSVLSEAGEEDAVIVCGSFYLAGEIREILTEESENARKKYI